MSSRAAMMHDAEQVDKSWFQRQKDKISDKKERRAQRKAEERKQRAEQEKQIRVSVSSCWGDPANNLRPKSRSTGRKGQNLCADNMPLKEWVHHLDTPLHPWYTDHH
jgi:hypothetical protein